MCIVLGTLFRGAKSCKNGKKGVFLLFDKFWKRHDGKITGKHAKMRK